MRNFKYVKLFENFKVAPHGKRTKGEILSMDNLENLSTKLNALKIKTADSEISYQISQVILLLDAWATEKLGLVLPGTEGNVYQDRINSSKDELIDDIKLQLQELLRFCSTGKYYDKMVQRYIEDLLQMI